ncbi:MAG: PqqD family protein [Bacilli bacterium]|nr:PqqD family protein [Bacilli bacterium]
MKIKYELAIQKVGERFVAVAVNEDAEKYTGMIKVNETGKRIIELLKDDTTVENVIEQMKKEYEGDEETISSAVKAFIASLKEKDLLSE